MYTQSEVERLKQSFNDEQKERKKFLKKVWGILQIVVVFICGLFILIFPNQFESGETAWILPTYGGLALAVTLIGFLISGKFISELPFYSFLYKEMYEKINLDEGLYLEYSAYSKTDLLFNKEGGLFTPHATPRVKRHISGSSNDNIAFDIYDCTLTTSSGNSSTTHLDGVFMSTTTPLNTSVHIRSNGTPRVKGTKFDKVEAITEFRVFKEQSEHMSNLDYTLLQFMTSLKETGKYKRLYLGVKDNKIKVALWYKKHPARKLKVIDINTLNDTYAYFISELELIQKLTTIGDY